MVFDEAKFLASYPQIAPATAGSGHPGHLTPEQEKALEHLRGLVHAQGYKERTDDATLLRFLRARKFNVSRAFEMYVACEKWRKEFGTNTILSDFEYPERYKVQNMYPKYYYKTDNDGRPVYYEYVGKVDYYALLKITTKERMLRELVREYEAFVRYRLPAASRKAGYLIETSCTVLDLKGVGLSAARNVYPFISEAAMIGQNYYPERMGKFFIVNAPWGFSAVWSMIKRFLDPATAEKIHILNHKYPDELKKQIPAENLPVVFGGTSKSEGPIWMSDDGPWQDSKFQGPEHENSEDSAGAGGVGTTGSAGTAGTATRHKHSSSPVSRASRPPSTHSVVSGKSYPPNVDNLSLKDVPVSAVRSEFRDAPAKLP